MYRNRSSNQKSFVATQRNVFTTNNFENYDLYYDLYSLIFLISFACRSHVIRMRLYFTYTYAHPIRMSFVCQSYVLACHSYVTCMYSSVIRMSLICTRMSPVCTRVSPVCHLYVLLFHPHVTRLWFYYEPYQTAQLAILCQFLPLNDIHLKN